MVENGEEDIDLNFVVEGDFFDGEEFVPVIESDRQELEIAVEDVVEPEEVDQEFSDDQNNIALPVDRDD